MDPEEYRINELMSLTRSETVIKSETNKTENECNFSENEFKFIGHKIC